MPGKRDGLDCVYGNEKIEFLPIQNNFVALRHVPSGMTFELSSQQPSQPALEWDLCLVPLKTLCLWQNSGNLHQLTPFEVGH